MFTIGSFTFTSQMFTSLMITLILCVGAYIAGKNLQMVPKARSLQNIFEIIVDVQRRFFTDVMGEYACRKYLPVVSSLFIYILLSNYSGLLPLSGHFPGLAAPTSSINFPLGLAVVVFFVTQIAGVREAGGPGFFKHLLKPVAFIFPLMVIEEFVRPLSLTLRLYGNIFGEESVIHSFFELIPFGVPIVMMALSVLMGLIQALVFSLLAAIYISSAVEEGHEERLHAAAHKAQKNPAA